MAKSKKLNALKFAQSLTPERLEFLSEFSEEAEELFCQLQLESESSESTIFGQDAVGTRGGERRKHSRPENEWTAEMAGEVIKSHQKNKVKKGKKPKLLPAILAHEEIQVMFEHTKDEPRDHLILRTLYATGVRRKELSKILKADLYLAELKIFIRSGKGAKDRYVVVDPTTAELLAEYTRNHRLEDSVFGVSDKTVARTVTAAAKETGITARYLAIGRKFTAHTFRHAFATHMYENGADLFVLQTLLGHHFLNVTKKYVHIGVGLIREDYVQAHPLAR